MGCTHDHPRMGCRPGEATLGAFESWATTMSGILDVAGVEGFMANANELYAEADVETLAWRDLTRIWWKRHGRDLVGASGLLSLLPDDADPFNLGAGGHRSRVTAFGARLRAARGRVFGGYRVVFAGTRDGASRYRLESIERADISEVVR